MTFNLLQAIIDYIFLYLTLTPFFEIVYDYSSKGSYQFAEDFESNRWMKMLTL